MWKVTIVREDGTRISTIVKSLTSLNIPNNTAQIIAEKIYSEEIPEDRVPKRLLKVAENLSILLEDNPIACLPLASALLYEYHMGRRKLNLKVLRAIAPYDMITKAIEKELISKTSRGGIMTPKLVKILEGVDYVVQD
ncbi:MAG TPA: hypothetical protein ENK81_02970 [Euryarchaeota archaeon]|nr:hypothetical protein [Euryarchaeota archaeon]